MKLQALNHRKLKRLAMALNVPRYAAVGILETLWLYCAEQMPAGNIGSLTDEEIAAEIDWTSDAAALVEALLAAGWLDADEACRLRIHDWPDHCPDYVHMRLARAGQHFADGQRPKLTRLRQSDRDAAVALLEAAEGERTHTEPTQNARRTHGVRAPHAQETHAARTTTPRHATPSHATPRHAQPRPPRAGEDDDNDGNGNEAGDVQPGGTRSTSNHAPEPRPGERGTGDPRGSEREAHKAEQKPAPAPLPKPARPSPPPVPPPPPTPRDPHSWGAAEEDELVALWRSEGGKGHGAPDRAKVNSMLYALRMGQADDGDYRPSDNPVGALGDVFRAWCAEWRPTNPKFIGSLSNFLTRGHHLRRLDSFRGIASDGDSGGESLSSDAKALLDE